eukprot:6838813-Prymnesium_polylepis.1
MCACGSRRSTASVAAGRRRQLRRARALNANGTRRERSQSRACTMSLCSLSRSADSCASELWEAVGGADHVFDASRCDRTATGRADLLDVAAGGSASGSGRQRARAHTHTCSSHE